MVFKEKVINKIAQKEGSEVRKILENLLQENAELRSGLNAVPEAIFIINHDHSLRFTNTTGKKFLNRENRYYGRSLLKSLRSKEIAHAIEDLLKMPFVTAQFHDIILFFRVPKDFRIGLFPIVTSPFPKIIKESQGTAPKQYLITINDVSELKQYYNEENKKNSINSLTMLTSGIAHEIKNPLSALDLHLQLITRMLKKLDAPQREEMNELLTVVNHEVKRLDLILNDFLQSFRPRRAIRKAADLNNIILLTVKLLKAKLDDRAIKVITKLDSKMKPFPLDENLIEQLLLNILENSIEAIEEKSNDAERRISVQTINQPQVLKVIIKDSGMGMNEEEITKIFDPFYTSKKMGTGLGLSIVSRILEEHHGTIFVESKKNIGTQLTLEFQKHPKQTLLLETKK